MDIINFVKLKNKISKKDFEGKFKNLNYWLFKSTFVSNVGSIFFAFFMVYPNLQKAISINIIDGIVSEIGAFIITISFLTLFEIIKREFFYSFSINFITNYKKFNISNFLWLLLSVVITALSFYLSIIGSKNIATTHVYDNNVIQIEYNQKRDSILKLFELKKLEYVEENNRLRAYNDKIRNKLTTIPITYVKIRRDYQDIIDKNQKIISDNLIKIDNLDNETNLSIATINEELQQEKLNKQNDEYQTISVLIIIAVICEIIIFCGIYFKEWYEFKLFNTYKIKYDKIILKRERYQILLQFVYYNGNLNVGDKIISSVELKKIISSTTKIPHSNKLIDEFFIDMQRLNIFNVVGKRRYIAMSYDDAIKTINNYDDVTIILDDLK